MNTIDVMGMECLTTNEVYDFLNCNSIRIERKLEDTYSPDLQVVELDNSVYYGKTKKMAEKSLTFIARIMDEESDKFKRFVNTKDARFKLNVMVNGVDYILYAIAGSQKSEIDHGPVKEYEFEMLIETRALRFITLEAEEQPQTNSGRYDVDRYGQEVYDGSVPEGQFNAMFSNDGDTDSYFIIEGMGMNAIPNIQINNTFRTFKSPISFDSEFYYSNIPLQLDVRLNDIRRPDMLLPEVKTFSIPIKDGINSIFIEGLKNVVVQVVKGYVII